jgi:hypothetical protein
LSDDPFKENDQEDWRGVAGELPDVQVQALEQMERTGSDPSAILAKAREFASGNLLGNLFASVEPPPGIARWHDFKGSADDGTAWLREFFGADIDFEGLHAMISGEQRSDGAIASAGLTISGHAVLTSDQCRQLAARLFASADEIDALLA